MVSGKVLAGYTLGAPCGKVNLRNYLLTIRYYNTLSRIIIASIVGSRPPRMGVSRASFIKYLESKTAKWPRRHIRHLFGSAGFFYGPKLFAFVMEDSFGIKVPQANRRELLKERGSLPASRQVRQFFNAGRPFGRWLEVPLPKTNREAAALVPYFRSAYLLARRGAK